MITATQCRSARTLLSWSLSKLASAASVPESVIDSFELERQQPDATTLSALQRAFEDVGLVFLPDDDVRVRAATSPNE
jgi:ribosome-binding protein aMBF1 (putative translation factor)